MARAGKAAKLAGLAIAGGLAVGAKNAIDAANNLGESVNAVNVVFGSAADQVLAFSENAATKAGLSMRAFNELVTPIGASLQNVGYSADEAAKASIALGQRAADMASVFNVDVKDALGAIQAGLRGEADPLERFGVGLSDAAVKAQAMSMGLAETEKSLTAADKAQARYALIMEQSNKVAGDFANTSGSMANQQRIMKAEFENLSASLGAALLPMVTRVMGVMLNMIQWIQANWPKVRAAVVPVMEDVQEIVGKVTAAIAGFWDRNGDRIMEIVRSVFGTIKQVIENTMTIIQGVIDVVMGTITGDWGRAWDGIKSVVTGVFDNILLALGTILPLMGAAALAIGTGIKDKVVEGITGLAGAAWNLIDNIGSKIGEMAETIAGWGTSVGSKVKTATVDAIVGIGTGAWNIIDNIGTTIAGYVDTIVGWGTGIGSKIKSAVADGLLGIGAAAWEVINNIGSFLTDTVKTITGWGRGIANSIKAGIANGLEGIGDWLWDQIKGGLSALKNKIGGFLGKLNPFGDASNPNFNPFIGTAGAVVGASGGINLMGANPEMMPFAVAAQGLGLQVTSGLRPGAITANGTLSDHARGKALDVAGSAFSMGAFFDSLVGNRAVKQAFYDPKGSIFGGLWNSYREGGHNDHVHVATYDRGGVLKPGLTLAYNGTGRDEYVGRSRGEIHLHFHGVFGDVPRQMIRKIQDGLREVGLIEHGGRVVNSVPTLS